MFLLTANTSAKLVRPTLPGARWVTKGFWYLGCVPSLASGHPGEGFWAVDPKGNRYTFNWMVRSFYPGLTTPAIQAGAQLVHNRSELRLYPTRVEDRFGSWVSYQWQGRKLLSISANDGRRIDFSYGADDQIVAATAHGKTWTYAFNEYPTASAGGRLTTVTNPDGSTWTYGVNPGHYVQYEPVYEMRPTYTQGGDLVVREYEVLEKVTFCSCDHALSPRVVPFEIKHPSGARGVFSFKTMRHGRTNVTGSCELSWDSDDNSNRDPQNNHNNFPAFKDVWSLQKKEVTGAGLTAASWNYAYDHLQACIAPFCANNGTPTRKTVTVTRPDGVLEISTFGKNFEVDEGQLLSVEIRQAGVVTSRLDYTYVSNAEAAHSLFPALVGETALEFPEPVASAGIRPLRMTRITQSGNAFTRATNSFNAFAMPTSVTKSSDLGYTRTDITDYQHDLAKWVINAEQREYNAETQQVIRETQFNANLLPERTYEFGKLKATLTYWPDGTIKTVADGRGLVTTISDYYRGIPRLLQYPATPESPAGASRRASVNDLGWIMSLTDELGSTTCYGYDAMGRLAEVRYPSESQAGVCDTSKWASRYQEFRELAAGEWMPTGVPMSRWRQMTQEGNHATVTYLDALWRPVLVHDYDASNVGPTLRSTRFAYDYNGKLSFQSYPTTDLIPGNTGVRTSYDSLGRVTRIETDSELGVLATTTEYLAGLKTRVTNPRGQQTTTAHMAFDMPNFEMPIQSSQPEGKVIEITRHPRFGWPLALTQRKSDSSLLQSRGYVYDGYAQLCKTIEPETGATVMGRDAAGNPLWAASGLIGGDYSNAADCSHAAAINSGRVVNRQYDACNRLAQLLFPDGRGNQAWTYEADGQPKTITVYNESNSGAGVTTTYAYNRRRLLTSESLSQANWYTWSTTYEYDSLGNLNRQVYPTGLAVDYAPNALGQQTRAGSFASNASYFPNGALKQFTYGNGLVYTMTQNARQLPMRSTSAGVNDLGYRYDANANISQILDHLRGTSFDRTMAYDDLDRLTAVGSASFGGDHWHRLTYDALDNIRSWKLGGVKDYADYSYDAQNRLTQVCNSLGASVMNLSYDPQGNLQSRNAQSYEFDFGNRLRSVPGIERYRYDGLGRRVQTTTQNDARTTLWMYNRAGQMMFSSDWDGPSYQHQKIHDMVYLAGSLIATVDHSWPSNALLATRYQHTDALGSPVAVSNEAGQVVERNDYEPYGAVIGKPNYSGIGYAGHVMDGATGLTNMQQRYYDASLGRFLSVDPVTAYEEPINKFNRYWYADANPYKYLDPDGRDTYIVNRQLRAMATPRRWLGGDDTPRARSRNNPITHTFVVVTNKDGSVRATYSWGNDQNLTGWTKNAPIDIAAAREALAQGKAERVGDASLDPYVESTFQSLNKPENEHENGIVTDNCKTEANKLVDTAKKERREDQNKASSSTSGFRGTFRVESRTESRQLDEEEV